MTWWDLTKELGRASVLELVQASVQVLGPGLALALARVLGPAVVRTGHMLCAALQSHCVAH